MPLFRRKPIIAFDLDGVKSSACRWRAFFNDAPYIPLSITESNYIESLLVVDLAYRLTITGKYRVVFFKSSVSRGAVRRDIHEYINTVTQYGPHHPPGKIVIASDLPPSAMAFFMGAIKMKNKHPIGTKLIIDDPIRFYENSAPSVASVESYLNEGYM